MSTWSIEGAPKRLGDLIRCKTVTPDENGSANFSEFIKLGGVLESNYPGVHAQMERERVDSHSLLYRWRGSDPQKAPIILMGHHDVVPAQGALWKHDPFGGHIDEGYIWGRGAIDMKGQLAAIFEACESLLAQGFSPERDVYIVSGHNEESVCDTGAQSIAKLLDKRGVRPMLVLDEGPFLTRLGGSGGLYAPIAVCEKGYADIRLSCKSGGGHASTPPRHTALGRVCRAVNRLERRPMKASLRQPTKRLVDAAPGMLTPYYRLLNRLGVFSAAVARGIAGTSDRGAALVRTTMAATMAKASPMPNVLPDYAETVLNCRIVPWESIDDVLSHMRLAIDDDLVNIELIKGNEPTPVSDVDGAAYKLVAGEVARMYPNVPIAPSMMLAATDSRYFHSICSCVLRFSPLRSMMKDHITMHAANERVSIESLMEAIEFFKGVIAGAQNVKE